MGGMISGILGGGQSDAQAGQRAALQRSARGLQQYRPEAMQARLNALSNMSTAYQGANNLMETMWGAPQGAAPRAPLLPPGVGGGGGAGQSPMGMAPQAARPPEPTAGPAPSSVWDRINGPGPSGSYWDAITGGKGR